MTRTELLWYWLVPRPQENRIQVIRKGQAALALLGFTVAAVIFFGILPL